MSNGAAADTILVIDDSLTFRAALKEELEDAGYRVITAESGETGLRLAAEMRPGAMIVDGILPGIDGATVIRRVRLDGALRGTPCLLLTAAEGKDAEIEALEAGADAFVRKGEDAAIVLARLAAILRGASKFDAVSTSLQTSRRILAVDDSETFLQELASSLRNEGYDVSLARSGREALDFLAAEVVDCVLLDLMMPDFAGDDVCRQIKSNPLTRHLPVLILTARDDQDSTIRGLTAGADDYIAKSSEFQVLRARVLAQIRRKQFEDENRHIREQILKREVEAAEARSAQELAEAHAALTEQARMKAEEADKAKSQFLAAMSHEIRTPMNGVMGVVELLMTTNLSPEQQNMMEIIRRSGITLLDVINGILDYSKIEVGRMTIETTPFSIVETVETTVQLIAAQAHSKPVEISCFIDPAINETLQGDPVRVRQIVLNIMGNALKFTERGTIRAEVMAETITPQAMTVLFRVTDTGIGMGPEERQRLFQPYHQANFSTTRKYGGTGLGLSICKNLLEMMSGEIGIESVVGVGSTFWFRVPFKRIAAPIAAPDFAATLGGLHAFVYCPAGTRSMVSDYLRAKGVDVIEESDVDDAMRTLDARKHEQRNVDIAILHAPAGSDGAKTILDALERRPGGVDLKCVLVLPHLSTTWDAAAPKLVVAKIHAPIRRERLYETLAVVTGRSSAREVEHENIGSLSFDAPSRGVAEAAGALVLVAEDNKTNQFVVQSQLKRLGIAFEIVSDGREAWNALSTHPGRYGLLLTDCHMPFIDGYKLTGLVRDQELTTKRRLPVVALTANALAGEAEICRAAGMDDHLAKPTNLETLNATLRKWLPRALELRREKETDGVKVDAAQETTKDGTTPIDLAGLAALTHDEDKTFTQDILASFRESEIDINIKLQDLIRAENSSGLRSEAHAAKGAARSAFAVRLADLYEQLETSAEKDDWRKIKDLGPEIETEFQRVMNFIDEFIQTR